MDRPPRWRRALGFARPHRGGIVLILLLTLSGGALTALEPLLFGKLFDALSGASSRALLRWLALLALLLVVREALQSAGNWLTWRARIQIHQDLLSETTSRLHRLPLSFHRKQGVGDVMTRMERGIQGLVTALSDIAFTVLPAAVYLVVAVAVMVRLDLRMTLLVLAFVPFPALVGVLAAPEQTRRERDLLGRWSKIYGRFHEVLGGILTVRSFGMEELERRRFVVEVRAANEVVVRGVARDSTVGALRNLLVAAARVGALGYGGWLVLHGQTTAGVVLSFAGYIGGLFGPVQGLTAVYQTLRKARVSVDAVFDILDIPDDPPDAPNALAIGTLRGDVAFERVSFAYEAGGKLALDDLTLRVAPGEQLALVGPSGSGKTTLVSLLKRLYDPTSGRVLIDGHDLRDLRQRSLRHQIGVVLQDGILFNDTVRGNIAYGRPDAPLDAVVQAARAANADAFIERLSEGYDTVLGERGSLLSVGQRQRIAIARALLKDPPILILDEATSALDAESEQRVQEALERLTQGRTCFVIAHRLSTVIGAHRIAVLRHGRIVELGTHAELLAQEGLYADLVRRQVRGLLAA